MLKFKREDVGLYVASMLIGGGIGFLVGSVIASKRKTNGIFEEAIEEEAPAVEDAWPIPEPLEKKKVRRTPAKAEKLFDPEMERLMETYTVSPVHIQLVEQNIISIEELESALKDSADPTNYSGGTFDYDDGKPDLEAMVQPPQEHGLFDGRNHISTEPFRKIPKSKYQQVFFDSMDESYSMMQDGKVLPWAGSGLVGDETWASIYNYLMAGVEPLYVHNTTMAKYFCFRLLPDDALDALEEYPDKDPRV